MSGPRCEELQELPGEEKEMPTCIFFCICLSAVSWDYFPCRASGSDSDGKHLPSSPCFS